MKNWRVASAAGAALIAIIATSYLALPVMATVVAVLIGLFAIGWPRLLNVPARKSLSAVIGLSAFAALLLGSITALGTAMAWMPAAIAVGVCAVFLIQLLRGTGQSHRLESTLGASAGVFIAGLGSGWVAADRLATNADNSGMMLITGISVTVAGLLCAIRWPDRIIAPLGILLGALAGPLGAMILTDVPGLAAGVIGAVCAAVVVSYRRLLLAQETPSGVLARLALATAPVLALGSIVYFLDKLLVS